jgi:large subunit ribosomal protein L13
MTKKLLTKTVLNSTKTTRPTTNGLNRQWFVIDASKEPLGRVASKIAIALMGKNQAKYSPDVDTGAVVVVLNAEKVVLTGQKAKWKNYFRHTGRPGGLKSIPFSRMLEKFPTKPIYLAVKNMIPKNRMSSSRLNRRLKILVGSEHNFNQPMKPLN